MKIQRQHAVRGSFVIACCIAASACYSQANSPQFPASTPQTPSQATKPDSAADQKPQDWNIHVQNTDIVQSTTGFASDYSGPNSLSSKAQTQHTSTLDLFAGKRLWKGAELHVDALMWQGFGLSSTLGVEAFPNGDAYKYGTNSPYFMFAHLFVRQTFGLGGPQEAVPDAQLSLAGKQDVKRITLTLGRFSPTDACDTNAYASSQHTQFMSWASVNNLAWDYAADSVGFASGFAAELNQPQWALRYGVFMLPSIPNSFTGDDQFLMWPHEGNFGPVFKEWAMNTEFERRYSVRNHPGTLRLQAWLDQANMANYADATAILKADGPSADWQAARSFKYKYGFGINWEQEVSKNVGVFSRLGWNDGKEEAWAFTDATCSALFGTSLNGDAWKRPGDTLGIAISVAGLSSQAQAFFQAGGLGILAGDGKLSYSPEDALESYYDTHITNNLRFSLDYQLVANPAFNRDRGPVSIFGARLHWEI